MIKKLIMTSLSMIAINANTIKEVDQLKSVLNQKKIRINELEVEKERLKYIKIEQIEKDINNKTLQFEKSIGFLKKYNKGINIKEELRKIKKEYKYDKVSLLKEKERIKKEVDDNLELIKKRNEILKLKTKAEELNNNYLIISEEYDITKNQITKDYKDRIKEIKIEYKNNLLKIQELYKLQINTIKSKADENK
jgi:hypothetical protein